jgi:hypothetical protein
MRPDELPVEKGLPEREEMNQKKVEFMHELISTFQAQAPDILVPVCPRDLVTCHLDCEWFSFRPETAAPTAGRAVIVVAEGTGLARTRLSGSKSSVEENNWNLAQSFPEAVCSPKGQRADTDTEGIWT